MTRPNDEQVGGTHYKDMTVQPWDAMRAWMSPEAFRGYLRGCTLKYLARCDVKGGIEDLRKARHYLDKLIETYEPSLASALNESMRAHLKEKYREPAVSESATGDTRVITNQVPVYAECGHPLRHCEKGYQAELRCSTCAWPGPDWSQAPEWAMWWCIDCGSRIGVWATNKFDIDGDPPQWKFPIGGLGRWECAPSFNYPGHWRDSLRERPKT